KTADLANKSVTIDKVNFITWHISLPTGKCISLPQICNAGYQALIGKPGWKPDSNKTDFQIICNVVNEPRFSIHYSYKPVCSEVDEYSAISISLYDPGKSGPNAVSNPTMCGVYDIFKGAHSSYVL